jgi:phage regulator Rha-like protein
MAKSTKNELQLADELIINKIYYVRDMKVMLDKDLAEMYGVETRVLNQSIQRNLRRFPDDFMFQLSKEEFENLKSQIATSSWGGTRKMPYAFTEQGVAMLSSVLNSDRAIDVNIQIIRIFTKIREMLSTHKDILLKIEQMERQVVSHSDEIQTIFNVLRELINPPQEKMNPIGYKLPKSPTDKKPRKTKK